MQIYELSTVIIFYELSTGIVQGHGRIVIEITLYSHHPVADPSICFLDLATAHSLQVLMERRTVYSLHVGRSFRHS